MSLNESECISDEVGLATDGIILHSYVFIAITFVVVLSGAILWYSYRNNSWLSRRKAGITFLYVIPIILNLIIGSIYRILLNTDIQFLSECGFGNFFLPSVVFSMLIPNMIRVILFVNRVKLNKKLVDYDTKREGMNTKSMIEAATEDGQTMTMSVHDMANNRSSVFFNKFSLKSSKRYRHHQLFHRHKYKASSAFGFWICLLAFFLFILVASIFTILTCPIKFLGTTNCQYGFSSVGTIFFVAPILPVLVTVVYFKMKARDAPDPFGLTKEISQFLIFIPIALLILILDFFNAFDLKEEGSVGFKFITAIDYLILFVFIHAIHYQVYLSTNQTLQEGLVVPINLAEVLEHPEGSQLFKRYLQTQFNVEMFIVYKLIDYWEKERTTPGVDLRHMDKRALRIFEDWVDRGGENIVVNISHTLYNQLHASMERLDEEDHYPADIFKDLKAELFQLMNIESFPRFTATEEYKVFSGLVEPITESMRSLKSERSRRKQQQLADINTGSGSGLFAQVL